MFTSKSQRLSSSSMLPLANGENDFTVFGESQPTIRGKGLGLAPVPQRSSLKYQGKLAVPQQKNALSDVNHKSLDEKYRLNVVSKKISEGKNDETEKEVPLTSKQGGVGKNAKGRGSFGDKGGIKSEVGRNVGRLHCDNLLSPCIPNTQDDGESRVEPIIQNYFDAHGEYPEIESITTNQPRYDDDWYYFLQYPQMVPETFDRSFDSIEDMEFDGSELCLDYSNRSPSPVSVAIPLNELRIDSAFEESCDTDWDADNSHSEVYIPTDHPFFAGYPD